MARLDEPTWRLGVVSAPAGFGKTVLLSRWVLDRADRPAWFSCDSSDAEPVRFWSGLTASLAARWPGTGDDAMVTLGRSGMEEQHAVISLANDLADVPAPLIVIDDLHFAKPTPSVFASFVGALPRAVRLIIGSRQQTPFSLARRRLAGDLLELRTEDLRFSAVEAAELLRHAEIDLAPEDMARLHELTEGWPAAQQRWHRAGKHQSENRQARIRVQSEPRGSRPADSLVYRDLPALPDSG
jgi:LuxR family maltose regulon positive regulatory protein